jgi:oxamate amidohydrolase
VAFHQAAVEAGRAILAEPNALKAMVAMAPTVAAVYSHINHVGGDMSFLVRERSGGRPRRRQSVGADWAASARQYRPLISAFHWKPSHATQRLFSLT